MVSETEGNDPFYRRAVENFYRETRRRHAKMPLVRRLRYGVAMCALPGTFDEYMGIIEASGRRNVKKAKRLGYRFEVIDFNAHLDDIAAIRTSTTVRQGRVSDELLSGRVEPCRNPPSRSRIHDYVYFGVLKERRLVAYAQCFIVGEACLLEHILGHYELLSDGIVPLLVTGIAHHCLGTYPQVKYYVYGTFFGATPTLRRFKKKFAFLPHTVKWKS